MKFKPWDHVTIIDIFTREECQAEHEGDSFWKISPFTPFFRYVYIYHFNWLMYTKCTCFWFFCVFFFIKLPLLNCKRIEIYGLTNFFFRCFFFKSFHWAIVIQENPILHGSIDDIKLLCSIYNYNKTLYPL